MNNKELYDSINKSLLAKMSRTGRNTVAKYLKRQKVKKSSQDRLDKAFREYCDMHIKWLQEEIDRLDGKKQFYETIKNWEV